MVLQQKWKQVVSACVCALWLFVQPFFVGAFGFDPQDGEQVADFFEQLLKVTEENYRYNVTYEQLLEAAVKQYLIDHPEQFAELAKGAYGALDENSRYLTRDEYEARMEGVDGEYVGIGVHLSESNGKSIVGAPIEGSPAASSGLRPGDIIVSVDGEDVTSYAMEKIVSLVRGQAGTTVEIGVDRGGVFHSFTITRALVKLNPVSYEALEGGVGYVKLAAFSSQCSTFFEQALTDLAAQNVDRIILDLRDNGGGYLSEAVRIASWFLPDDVLVTTESYKNEKQNVAYRTKHTDRKFKVVVLVNENSASASELVAGAIRDHKAGPLVGKTTFGKGTVQTSVAMKNKDAIWLTIAQYDLPSGENIHGKGIVPDYLQSNRRVPVDISNMQPLDASRIYQLGDQGEGVLAIKQRLQALGYQFSVMNDVYDDRMVDVTTHFQQETELFPYGVMDMTTQLKLVERVREATVEEDTQFERALQLILEQ